MGCERGHQFFIKLARLDIECFESCLSGICQAQGLVASVIILAPAFKKPFTPKRGDRPADLRLVNPRTGADLGCRHLSMPSQMKKYPPFGPKHSIAGFVERLESGTCGFGGHGKHVGREVAEIECIARCHDMIHMVVSYKIN